MNPWYFLTVPLGMFVVVFTVAFAYFLVRQSAVSQRVRDEVERVLNEELYPVNVEDVWKMTENCDSEPELYVRVRKG
jgi:hypothetical protein